MSSISQVPISSQLDPFKDAMQDLRTSGLAPEIIGAPWQDILRDICPLNSNLAEKFFKNSILYTSKGSLRTQSGYFWKYSGTLRLKNLDPQFQLYEGGKPVINPISGEPVSIKYLSPPGGKNHLYLRDDEWKNVSSPKAAFFFTEGEKKKSLLYYLLLLRRKHPEWRNPLSPEFKYVTVSGSGIYNFISSPEWKTLQVSGKPCFLVFDADWEHNTNVPLAELKLTAALMCKGVPLSKISSLIWPENSGKGIDDYLYNYYKVSTTEDDSAPSENHPMLNALGQLYEFAQNPLKKYSQFGIDFLCQSLASVQKLTNFSLSDSHIEEIIDLLSEIFPSYRVSVIRQTLKSKIKLISSESESRSPLPTELRNAEMFAQQFSNKLKWDTTRQKFFVWTGKIWQADEAGQSEQWAKQTIRSIQLTIPDMLKEDPEKGRKLLAIAYNQWERVSHLRNILAHAKSEPGIPVSTALWDKDPLKLNCLNGIFLLDQFKFIPHNPSHFMTLSTNVDYNPDATFEKWSTFLNLIFDNTPEITQYFLDEIEDFSPNALKIFEHAKNKPLTEDELLRLALSAFELNLHSMTTTEQGMSEKELKTSFLHYVRHRARKRQNLVDFVQKVVGISCSGLSDEKIILFCYGPKGNNGKSTFFNIIENVLGSYFGRISADTLMLKSSGSSINEDLASLQGLRFVVTDEMAGNRKLDIGLVKTLTGADQKLRAQRKYEHTFSFDPSHTIWLYGNQLPNVGNGQDPIWERIKVIPFTVKLTDLPGFHPLPQSQVLHNLLEEGSGILNWILLGFKMYQEEGLSIPDEVETASRTYQHDEDLVEAFIEECCFVSQTADIARSDLYKEYLRWSGENLEKFPMGKRIFFRELTLRGFPLVRKSGNRFFFQGITLLSDDVTDHFSGTKSSI